MAGSIPQTLWISAINSGVTSNPPDVPN